MNPLSPLASASPAGTEPAGPVAKAIRLRPSGLDRVSTTIASLSPPLFVFALVFVAYLALVVLGPRVLQQSELYSATPYPDGYGYVSAQFAAGEGYRFCNECAATTFREPGYILVVAGIFKAFGESPVAARIANIILAFAAAYLVYRICLVLQIREGLSRLAALGVLVFPYIAFSVLRISPEILYTTLILAAVYAMLLARRSGRLGTHAAAALVLGLAALTRSTIIPFAGVYGIYVLLGSRPAWRQGLMRMAVFAAVFALVYSPWPIRNYLLTGQPVITATVAGDALFQGMYVSQHSDDDKAYQDILTEASNQQMRIFDAKGLPYSKGFFQFHDTPEQEVRHNQILVAESLQAYRAAPLLYLKTVTRNLWAFWVKGRENAATVLNSVFMVPLLTAAVAGVVGFRRDVAPGVGLMLLLVLVCYAVQVAIFSHARHAVPVIPYLIIFAALPFNRPQSSPAG